MLKIAGQTIKPDPTKVHPKGFEPLPSEPESEILSIIQRVQKDCKTSVLIEISQQTFVMPEKKRLRASVLNAKKTGYI